MADPFFGDQTPRLLRQHWGGPEETGADALAQELHGMVRVAADEDEEEAGTGTNVFLGQVVGGSGQTYLVNLFGNGSGQGATDQVEATCPQIDAGEQIPGGTWIAAVHRFEAENGTVTYEFQVPVWI